MLKLGFQWVFCTMIHNTSINRTNSCQSVSAKSNQPIKHFWICRTCHLVYIFNHISYISIWTDTICLLEFMGIGPKGCIASRFARLQIKLTMASLLLKYRFELGAQHINKELKLDLRTISTAPLGGINVQMHSRWNPKLLLNLCSAILWILMIDTLIMTNCFFFFELFHPWIHKQLRLIKLVQYSK